MAKTARVNKGRPGRERNIPDRTTSEAGVDDAYDRVITEKTGL